MNQININMPVLDEIEQRLESIESKLKEIHKEKAQKPYGLLTSIEAAKALQITTRHLQNLRDRGDIGFIQYRRYVRFKPEDLQAYIDEFYVRPRTLEGGVS